MKQIFTKATSRVVLAVVNLFVFVFQPTHVLALSKEDHHGIKEFLEVTQITQREVLLSELVTKISPRLPTEVREKIAKILEGQADIEMPKLSVSKIKGDNGEEDIQLQVVKDRNSLVFTIQNRGGIFAKIDGVAFTLDEVLAIDPYIEKLNSPPNDNGRSPASEKPTLAFKVLSSADFQKLSESEKKQYLKSLREVMGDLEQLQNLQIKTHQSQNSHVFEYFYQQLFEAQSFAAAPDGGDGADPKDPVNTAVSKSLVINAPCIYAGHLADYGCKVKAPKSNKCDYKNGFQCGGYGSRFMKEQLEKDLACKLNGKPGIQCFAGVFGKGADGQGICVSRINDATKECIQKSSKFDYFEAKKYAGTAEWEKMKEGLEGLVKKQTDFCGTLGDVPPPALKDQFETCNFLKNRVADIMKTLCPFVGGDGASKAALEGYVNKNRFDRASYCVKQGVAQPPPVPVPVCAADQGKNSDGQCVPCAAIGGAVKEGKCEVKIAQPPSPAAAPADTGNCSGPGWINDSGLQPGCTNSGGVIVKCGETPSWRCNCGGTTAIAQNSVIIRCLSSSSASAGSTTSAGTATAVRSSKPPIPWYKTETAKKTALAILGVGLTYFALKASLKSKYKQLNTSPAATPVPGATNLPRNRGTR